MAVHLVSTSDKSHESEATQVLMFCFDNASPERACFVVDLIPFVSPSLHIFVFLSATSILKGINYLFVVIYLCFFISVIILHCLVTLTH